MLNPIDYAIYITEFGLRALSSRSAVQPTLHTIWNVQLLDL